MYADLEKGVNGAITAHEFFQLAKRGQYGGDLE